MRPAHESRSRALGPLSGMHLAQGQPTLSLVGAQQAYRLRRKGVTPPGAVYLLIGAAMALALLCGGAL